MQLIELFVEGDMYMVYICTSTCLVHSCSNTEYRHGYPQGWPYVLLGPPS